MAKICSITLPVWAKRDSQESLLSQWSELIEEAAFDKPDLILLPEICAQYHIPSEEYGNINEPANGPLFQFFADKAAKHGCYIIAPAIIRTDGKLYNQAFVIDRNGQMMGSYRKNFPTYIELDHGIEPGRELPVFDTDFGKVAVVICFDMNFLEIGRELKKKNVKFICLSTMAVFHLHMKWWAFEFQSYMISAVSPGRKAQIVNPFGNVISESSNYKPIMCKNIGSDFIVIPIISVNFNKMKAIKAAYGENVKIDLCEEDGRILIAPVNNSVTTEELIKQFDLLLTDDYFNESRLKCGRI